MERILSLMLGIVPIVSPVFASPAQEGGVPRDEKAPREVNEPGFWRPVFEGRGGHGYEKGIGRRLFERLETLGLSLEQKRKIVGILKEDREKIRALADAAREARGELVQATQNGSSDENAIRKLSRKEAVAEEELAVLRARTRAKVHEILTPEQRKKFAEMTGKKRERLGRFAQDARRAIDRWVDRYSGEEG